MTEFLSAILTGTPNRSDNGARRWPVVVYAGIASLVAAAIFVAVGAVREIRELSRAGTSQSLWHVYQTHDAVQRVAAAAPEATLTQAGKDRFQTELELLASQVAAVREYRMLDLQLPRHAEAWKSIEHRLTMPQNFRRMSPPPSTPMFVVNAHRVIRSIKKPYSFTPSSVAVPV